MMMWEELEVEHVQIAAITVVLASAVIWVIRYAWKSKITNDRIKNRQQRCLEAKTTLQRFIEEEGLSKKDMDAILNLNFRELHGKLQSGKLKAVDVVKAYQAKALEMNTNLNFIVEPVKEAMTWAEELDLEKKKKRPLHGIPISVKENYFIKSYESTGGQSILINKPATQDGEIIQVLRSLGCVPFMRTNIPQSMMTFECSNPIYGTTLNPYNLNRGPGGSSGGEACILATGASILGWGSDIGGSLRIPAHFCGVCSLKPTAGRLGYRSSEELIYGQTAIRATVGPMGRDVDTLVIAMREVLCAQMFAVEAQIPPLTFNQKMYDSKQPLRIGYYSNDGCTQPLPGVERGLEEAKAALEKMGHTLVPFTVPDAEYMFGSLFMRCCFGDGGDGFLTQMKDDQIDPSINMLIQLYRLPTFIIRALSHIVDLVSSEKLPGVTLRSILGLKSVKEFWKLADDIDKYKRKFHALWLASKLDAMICPSFPYVAPPTGMVKYLTGGASYSTLYNLVNYPAGCVPVTRVTAIDQVKMSAYPNKTQTDKFMRKFFSTDTTGLPVTVQCVTLPFTEELCLRVMKDVETGLGRPWDLRSQS